MEKYCYDFLLVYFHISEGHFHIHCVHTMDFTHKTCAVALTWNGSNPENFLKQKCQPLQVSAWNKSSHLDVYHHNELIMLDMRFTGNQPITRSALSANFEGFI